MPKILWIICIISIILHLVKMLANIKTKRMFESEEYSEGIYIMAGAIIVIIDFLCFYGGWKLFSYLVGIVK